MAKKSELPQSPHHLYVWDEDWEYLISRFGQGGVNPVGVSDVIRRLVAAWRDAENRLRTANIKFKGETEHATSNISSTPGSEV
jgi:hypothetical protein